MTRYSLEPLTPAEVSRWDELTSPYDGRQLFHHKAWLDQLAVAHRAAIGLWAIRAGGRTVGYFCGGIVKKGPFRVLGSPLKGWYTNFMGPIVNSDFDQSAFLAAIDDLAAEERLAMVEIESPRLLDHGLCKFNYEPVDQPTYVIDIVPDRLDTMWKRLHRKARKAVRVAKEHGVMVEDTDDPAIIDELYDELAERLARKKTSLRFSKHLPQLTFRYLRPLNLIFALRVLDPQRRTIATGLFPHDDRTMYFAFTGSRMSAWNLFPNDLMHWAVIELAAAQGIRAYNMCGFGRFKSKFGGTLQVSRRWHKCYWQSARWARQGYATFFNTRMTLRGYWNNLAYRYAGTHDVEEDPD
jgi:hypothetical protein